MQNFFSRWSRLLLLALPFAAQAQSGVGIGTTAPDASAGLDVVSTNKGALLPRLTSAQRTAIAAPATGLLVFQTTAPAGFYYNAGTPGAPAWQLIGTTAAGDNLGNHTATQALNLRANPVVGTGASIGTAVGVGVTANGGLNIGQNTTGTNVYLGYLSGAATPTGGNNTFVGTRSGAANTSGGNNTFAGTRSGAANTAGGNNTFAGFNSGQANTTGSSNTFAGSGSGQANTLGSSNTFAGASSGLVNSTGNNNTFVGASSGRTNTTGSSNVFAGGNSGAANTVGANNVFVGQNSGAANTSGQQNTFAGANSGRANTVGSGNTFTGSNSGLGTSSNSNNTFTGANTGRTNNAGGNTFTGFDSGAATTTGGNNTFAGSSSGVANTTGGSNTFAGALSGVRNTSGQQNTFVGVNSGQANSIGNANVFIGAFSGQDNTTGFSNTVVGHFANVSVGNLTNATALGRGAVVNASNKIRLGNTAVTRIEGQVAYSFPSDARFKYDVQANVPGLAFIRRLRPVTYRFDGAKLDRYVATGELPAGFTPQAGAAVQTGFLAQDVEAAARAVGFRFDGVHAPANARDHYSLAYSQFVMPLVRAVQEQQQQIEALQAENTALRTSAAQAAADHASLLTLQAQVARLLGETRQGETAPSEALPGTTPAGAQARK